MPSSFLHKFLRKLASAIALFMMCGAPGVANAEAERAQFAYKPARGDDRSVERVIPGVDDNGNAVRQGGFRRACGGILPASRSRNKAMCAAPDAASVSRVRRVLVDAATDANGGSVAAAAVATPGAVADAAVHPDVVAAGEQQATAEQQRRPREFSGCPQGAVS